MCNTELTAFDIIRNFAEALHYSELIASGEVSRNDNLPYAEFREETAEELYGTEILVGFCFYSYDDPRGYVLVTKVNGKWEIKPVSDWEEQHKLVYIVKTLGTLYANRK